MILSIALFTVAAASWGQSPAWAGPPPSRGTQTEDEIGRAVLQQVIERSRTTRDPFKPQERSVNGVEVSDLELYTAERYTVTGLIKGLPKLKAMVVSPNGKTHFVGEGTRIRNRKGVVHRITPEGVIVREKIVNALGAEESVEVRLLVGGVITDGGSR